MNNYKLTIQYDGGRYKGWQRLGNTENTIQGKIENVLSEMVGKNIEIIGSGRTDAGVHALAQIANVKLAEKLQEFEVQQYLNRYLPHDISVTDVKLVNDRFHARYNAKDKTYLYKIWNESYTNPFMRKHSLHVEKKLDLEKIKEASRYFEGEHDFTAFSNAKSKKKSMVRHIYSIQIEEEAGFINIRIKGNGFLYNMVRKMVGTLIDVGLGERNPEEVKNMLESHDRSLAGFADAHGLYLEKIDF
ncbi:tRNA pseudouridine(38-40) synthase TruA [Alkalihalobacillus sp. MEB130]|uniref:tRNA pseudouridine(38-40) synthase TruA n=1 Tax=Alkalihalobacillus sp. MEB130 TaxID=2976704 RepID=UPI0028DF55A9|nr:tRNA pseudouridine(38-40) synthase TruA [Alkalihalobacillus sp. MEB130]MDT8860866.1 tRNA pseudouridine(38-40) synthase TruA [Alkalihalobacillus sp. MEB130]